MKSESMKSEDIRWSKFTLHRANRPNKEGVDAIALSLVPEGHKADIDFNKIKGEIEKATFEFPAVESIADVEKLAKVMPNLYGFLQAKLASFFLSEIAATAKGAATIPTFDHEAVMSRLNGEEKIQQRVKKMSKVERAALLAALQAEEAA